MVKECAEFCGGNQKESGYFSDLHVGGILTLKWIPKEEDLRMSSEFSRLRIGFGTGLLRIW
jgi:hypothetical protein